MQKGVRGGCGEGAATIFNLEIAVLKMQKIRVVLFLNQSTSIVCASLTPPPPCSRAKMNCTMHSSNESDASPEAVTLGAELLQRQWAADWDQAHHSPKAAGCPIGWVLYEDDWGCCKGACPRGAEWTDMDANCFLPPPRADVAAIAKLATFQAGGAPDCASVVAARMHGVALVEVMELDLASLASVRKFAAAFQVWNYFAYSNPVLLSILTDSLARSSITHLRVNSRCLYKGQRGRRGV